MIKIYPDYEDYSPWEFIKLVTFDHKTNIIDRYDEIINFLIYYFTLHNWEDIQKAKHLFQSPDKECNQLGLQLLFAGHEAAFSWISNIYPYMLIELAEYFQKVTINS